MGFLAGMAGGCFKHDNDGCTVFFPHGIVGSGRIVSSGLERRVRSFLKIYYLFVFGSSLAGIASGWPYVPIPLLLIAYYLGIHALLRNCPRSSERLALREAISGSAQGHSYLSILVLFCAATGSFLAVLYKMTVGPSVWVNGLFVWCVLATLGLVSVAFGWMLRDKLLKKL